MKIAVLFDGMGLSRLGLQEAGHDCTGIELAPEPHYIGGLIDGDVHLADVRSPVSYLTIKDSHAVWASPPCQEISAARTQGAAVGDYTENLLGWSLALRDKFDHLEFLWVENVKQYGRGKNDWGVLYNAAQFEGARQNRQRVVGGHYPAPAVQREFAMYYPEMNLCPCITATEYKVCASDTRRASRYYGRRLTVAECAYHMGLDEPLKQLIDDLQAPEWWTDRPSDWKHAKYRALGNGVPVWMAKAFGAAI